MKIKHILLIILVFVLCFGVCSFALADETAEVPEGYTPIYTAEDLYNIRNDLDGKFILMNDIDLSVYENWKPIGSSETPFTGELDGNGNLIKSLTILAELKKPTTYYYGLFSYIKNSKIHNILLIDSDIKVTYSGTETARCNLGTIAGGGYMSEITGCGVSGNISTGKFFTTVAGGILGRNEMLCTLESCANYTYINADVSALSKYVYVGGISGVASDNEKECCNFGEIKVKGENIIPECQVMVGGIDGSGYEASILTNCYNRSNISIDFSTSNTFVGGISGTSFITKNTYNTGEINLPDDFSGYSGAISGSIGMGGVSTPVVGIPTSHIENVYYLESDLIIGYSDRLHPDKHSEKDYASVYKNFAELSEENIKKQESFIGFDFENVWEMEENGYPVLQNQPILPENIPERPTTTESTTESTTEPSTEPNTETSTESTTESTTEPSTEDITEPSTEPSDDECPLANLWIVKVIKWLFDSIWNVIENIMNLF